MMDTWEEITTSAEYILGWERGVDDLKDYLRKHPGEIV
jgi:hypothetical protein